MSDEEANAQLDRMIADVSQTSAQLAARMALAIQSGVSPNRVENWVRTVVPMDPQTWAMTMAMAKNILDVVLKEIEYMNEFMERRNK